MQKIKQLLRTTSELWLIPLALVLFFSMPLALRIVDPTTAAFDPGILQAVVAAIVQLLFITGFVYLFMSIRFPTIFTYLDIILCEDFKKLSRQEKVRTSLGLFLALLAACVLLTWALLN